MNAQRDLHPLGQLSFVGERLPFLYTAVPKAACSTVKKLLYSLEGKPIPARIPGLPNVHLRSVDGIPSLTSFPLDVRARILADRDRVKFTVVRNPYARVAAAWATKIHQQAPPYIKLQRQISKYCGLADAIVPDFGQFVRWLTNTQPPPAADPHWRPMHLILRQDLIEYDVIAHIEQLAATLTPVFSRLGVAAEDFPSLLAAHTEYRTLPIDWQALYDEELAERAYEYYRADFELYAYDKNSWCADNNQRGDRTPAIDAALLHERALEIIRSKNHRIMVLEELLEAGRRAQSNS